MLSACRGGFALTIQGHGHLTGIPTAAADPADVEPARPRRRRQGHRTAGAAARGSGPPPAVPPPPAATRRPSGAGGVVAAAAPCPLVDLLRHPGDAVALAPPAARPTLDLSTRSARSITDRSRHPGAGA